MSAGLVQGCEIRGHGKVGIHRLEVTTLDSEETDEYYACAYCKADLENDDRYEVEVLDDD